MVVGGVARYDAAGVNQLCEHCGIRLNRIKHTRAHGPGRVCHPRCKGIKHTIEERAASSEPAKKKQRRTNSDPGQPLPITSTRLRIRAPKPPPTIEPRLMKPTVDPVDPMALLEAAHARRMALLEAQKNGIGSSAMNASAVVWQ
jgi:hypothetical protein